MKEKTILAIARPHRRRRTDRRGPAAQCAVHGGKAVTLALTAGEKGAPVGADIEEYRRSKIREAEAFAAELGGRAIVLDYADGLLPDNDEVRFRVCDVIREVKPDIIVTHHEKKYAQGPCRLPQNCSGRLVLCGHCRIPAGAAPAFRRKALLCGELGGCAGVPAPGLPGCVRWIFPVEKAIEHHWFAVHSTSFPYKEYYSHLKRLRGIEGRKGYCECFMILPEQRHAVHSLEEL